MTEVARTQYLIPEANWPRFEKEIAKLSRKSVKLTGEPIEALPFGYTFVENGDGTSTKMMEVSLFADAPKLNGWTFIARLDHSAESGNIIRMVPNAPALPESYRQAAPSCDHCGYKRKRRDTFVLFSETEGYKQVGATCLTDFFGHDPYAIAKRAELLSYAEEAMRAGQTAGEGLIDRRWISLSEFLAVTAMVVRKRGWMPASRAPEPAQATKNIAFNWLGAEPTSEDYALAERALDWAQSLKDKADMNDYEHNVSVIADSLYIEHRSIGIAASIVGVFYTRERQASGASTVAQVGDLSGLIALMTNAKRLAYPKITLRQENGEPIVLSLAGKKSSQPGNINLTDGGPYGDNVWYGRVSPEGRFVPSRAVTDRNRAGLLSLLTAMAADPAATAAQYGKLTGQCCFCRKGLTDERSVRVGYGPTCASNYGLPHG